MWLWLLVTTGILMSCCRVSGKPIVTGITGGMASDGLSSTQKGDTYLRFKPRTRSSNSDTEDTVRGAILHDTAEPNDNNGVKDTPNVPSNYGIQGVTNDGNEANVAGDKKDERNYDIMAKGDDEDKPQARDKTISYDEGKGDGELQNIGNGDVYGNEGDKEGTLQSVGDGKLYGEQGDDNNTPQITANGDIYGNLGDKAGTLHSIDDGKLYDEQGDENGAPQIIANGYIGDEEGNGEQGDGNGASPSIDLGKIYGDEVAAAWNLKNDDAMSRALETLARDVKQSQGSNVAPVVDNKVDALHKTAENNVDLTKDNRRNPDEGDSNHDYGQETVNKETSKDYIEDKYLDSAATEAGEGLDLDNVINTLTQILGGGIPEDGYAITGTTGHAFVIQDSTLKNEGHLDLGNVYSHSQSSSIAPKEMTQSEEKTEENGNGREYPSFYAIIDISQTENSDVIDLDDISESIISEVESMALPLLQIANDARPYDDTVTSDKREVIPREDSIYFRETTGGTTLAIRENNGNRDSLDAPLQAVNEIPIIYSL